MGRKRKANLEVEYELERQIKDLKQEVSKLKKILRAKEKKEVKEDVTVEVKKVKKQVVDKPCPKCGSKIKSSPLPMGTLELCEAACGFRLVRKNNE